MSVIAIGQVHYTEIRLQDIQVSKCNRSAEGRHVVKISTSIATGILKFQNGLAEFGLQDIQVGQCNISAEGRKTVSIALALVTIAPAITFT
jgi:hypothetical protein